MRINNPGLISNKRKPQQPPPPPPLLHTTAAAAAATTTANSVKEETCHSHLSPADTAATQATASEAAAIANNLEGEISFWL